MIPVHFEPFYSDGARTVGLGLYIARQLLERHDYSMILLIQKVTSCCRANFVVSFVKEKRNARIRRYFTASQS